MICAVTQRTLKFKVRSCLPVEYFRVIFQNQVKSKYIDLIWFIFWIQILVHTSSSISKHKTIMCLFMVLGLYSAESCYITADRCYYHPLVFKSTVHKKKEEQSPYSRNELKRKQRKKITNSFVCYRQWFVAVSSLPSFILSYASLLYTPHV